MKLLHWVTIFTAWKKIRIFWFQLCKSKCFISIFFYRCMFGWFWWQARRITFESISMPALVTVNPTSYDHLQGISSDWAEASSWTQGWSDLTLAVKCLCDVIKQVSNNTVTTSISPKILWVWTVLDVNCYLTGAWKHTNVRE